MKLKNRITASILAGAAGDALGYAVEFMTRKSILSHYGEGGIRRPDLVDGEAWFSDDTQMTLFTAAGLLSALKKKAQNPGGRIAKPWWRQPIRNGF